MIKILSVGNSFSQDAQRYLHAFAEAAGDDILTCNLYIGGCSLETHWHNFVSDAKAYDYEVNGADAHGVKSSISGALAAQDWDIITVQQVSHLTGVGESYEPYLENLVTAIRAMCPDAKLYFHETWEYEYCSNHSCFDTYDFNCETMYQAIRKTTRAAADALDLTLIPSGDAVHLAKTMPEFDSENGGQSLYRDAFHMHLVYGRYLLACVWYKTLLHKSPVGIPFVPEDGACREELLPLLAKAAQSCTGQR